MLEDYLKNHKKSVNWDTVFKEMTFENTFLFVFNGVKQWNCEIVKNCKIRNKMKFTAQALSMLIWHHHYSEMFMLYNIDSNYMKNYCINESINESF